MTRQIQDTLTWKPYYEGQNYTIFSIRPASNDSKSTLFNPSEYGLKPDMCGTACYRGCYMKYEVVGNRLILNKLAVYTEGGYPSINGKNAICTNIAEEAEGWPVFHEYSDLNIPITFTGTLMVGIDLLDHSPSNCWPTFKSFRTVYQIELVNGVVEKATDISDEISDIKEAQHDLQLFRLNNWMTEEWENKLGILNDKGIEDLFGQRTMPVTTANTLKTIKEIEATRNTPCWFITNYIDFYERCHCYHYQISQLKLLGCPNTVIEFLTALTFPEVSQEKIIVAFLETIKSVLGNDIWGETLGIIIGRQFKQDALDPLICEKITQKLSRTTLAAW